ncbi:hypothetical protein MTO96_002774 [Rhipicephalus appendiculatus]
MVFAVAAFACTRDALSQPAPRRRYRSEHRYRRKRGGVHQPRATENSASGIPMQMSLPLSSSTLDVPQRVPEKKLCAILIENEAKSVAGNESLHGNYVVSEEMRPEVPSRI